MSGNPQETKQPEEQDGSHDSGWLSRLNYLQKVLAAILAILVSVGALGTAAYVARNSWERAIGATDNSGPPTATTGPANPTLLNPPRPSPSTPSSPGSPVPSLPQPGALGQGHISGVTSPGSSCADPVTVSIVISSPASADRELWLIAIVMTGAPIHPVYYAKKELDNTAGQQTATIQFYGATNGSVRNLVIVSSARASFTWLQQNLANDGNPAWDTHRTTKPSDVPAISPSYEVTTHC